MKDPQPIKTVCVMARCVYSRRGMASLMSASWHCKEILQAQKPRDLSLKLKHLTKPLDVFVVVLSAELGQLLDELIFLRDLLFLTGRKRLFVAKRVVILAEQDTEWLYGTLCTMLRHRAQYLAHVTVLDGSGTLQTLFDSVSALITTDSVDYIVPFRAPGQSVLLSLAEARVLRDMLVYESPLIVQAKTRGMSVKTLYGQRRSGMRKLGTRTLKGLLTWDNTASPLGFDDFVDVA